MQHRIILSAGLFAAIAVTPAHAQSNLGGGFIEFLFNGTNAPQQRYAPPPGYQQEQPYGRSPYARQRQDYLPPPPDAQQQPVYLEPQSAPGSAYPEVFPQRQGQRPLVRQAMAPANPAIREIDPKYLPQEVSYDGPEKPGTIVINTPERFLYLVQAGGKARRYGIGVGRPGFEWAGEHKVTAKKEWPEWVPPPEMIKRQPYLPRRMAGGPNNPLGARAMYLGSTLYRIHGSNEPWTIGQAVSSGCIRMRNQDVTDLYGRVEVGATVIVI